MAVIYFLTIKILKNKNIWKPANNLKSFLKFLARFFHFHIGKSSI
jgi:hypothetical protein